MSIPHELIADCILGSSPCRGQHNLFKSGHDTSGNQVQISFSIPASVAAQSDFMFTFSPSHGRVSHTNTKVDDHATSSSDFVPKLLKFEKSNDSAITARTGITSGRLTQESSDVFGSQGVTLVNNASGSQDFASAFASIKVVDLDEACAPDPVYPRNKGSVHTMDPLPETAVAPNWIIHFKPLDYSKDLRSPRRDLDEDPTESRRELSWIWLVRHTDNFVASADEINDSRLL